MSMTVRKYPGSLLTAISVLALLTALSAGLSLRGEVFYPWKGTYIGALEGKEWFGLVLAPARDVAFGLRVRVQKEGQAAAGDDFFYLVSEVGPNSPDGQYARIVADLSLPFNQGNDTPILIKPPSKSDQLILEWSRQDDRTVLGRIRAPKDISLQIIHYFPWNFKGEYHLLPFLRKKRETSTSSPPSERTPRSCRTRSTATRTGKPSSPSSGTRRLVTKTSG
jgi:hypothetical protein